MSHNTLATYNCAISQFLRHLEINFLTFFQTLDNSHVNIVLSLNLWFMALYGPLRPFMVPYDQDWSHMVLYGHIWSCMAYFGPVRPYLFPYICLHLLNSSNLCTNFVLVTFHSNLNVCEVRRKRWKRPRSKLCFCVSWCKHE